MSEWVLESECFVIKSIEYINVQGNVSYYQGRYAWWICDFDNEYGDAIINDTKLMKSHIGSRDQAKKECEYALKAYEEHKMMKH